MGVADPRAPLPLPQVAFFLVFHLERHWDTEVLKAAAARHAFPGQEVTGGSVMSSLQLIAWSGALAVDALNLGEPRAPQAQILSVGAIAWPLGRGDALYSFPGDL